MVVNGQEGWLALVDDRVCAYMDIATWLRIATEPSPNSFECNFLRAVVVSKGMLRVFALAVVGIVLTCLLLLAAFDSPTKVSPQGCRMSYMWPSYILQAGLDGTWSKLASRYSLWLYREADLEPESEVCAVLSIC